MAKKTPIAQLAKTAAATVQKVQRKTEQNQKEEPLPKFKRVASSNLRRVMYDKRSMTLTIEFNSRRTYTYNGVPAIIHSGLLTAPSKGTYFNQYIKYRFPFVEG